MDGGKEIYVMVIWKKTWSLWYWSDGEECCDSGGSKKGEMWQLYLFLRMMC